MWLATIGGYIVLRDVPLSQEIRIKGFGSVGYNSNILHLEVGNNIHLLSIDPNFQRDIRTYLRIRYHTTSRPTTNRPKNPCWLLFRSYPVFFFAPKNWHHFLFTKRKNIYSTWRSPILVDLVKGPKINQYVEIVPSTPWKINMEPINQPFRKENHLPNLHDYVPC